MAQRALLRNKLLGLLMIGVFACHTHDPVVPNNDLLMINKTDNSLVFVNGVLQFQDHPFSGTLYQLYPGTKDTSSLENYLQGREDGIWKKYYPSAKIREIRTFEHGQKTGKYLAWWENGNKQLEYYFANDEYEGTCREWSEAGTLTKEMNYQHGYELGHEQCWYDNGKIKANYVMKDGRRYGLLGTKNCINVSDSIFKN